MDRERPTVIGDHQHVIHAVDAKCRGIGIISILDQLNKRAGFVAFGYILLHLAQVPKQLRRAGGFSEEFFLKIKYYGWLHVVSTFMEGVSVGIA